MIAMNLSSKTALQRSENTPNRYHPARYYFLTVLITWATWLIAAYLSYQPGGESSFVMFLIPGMMAPTLVGLGMILFSKSRELKQGFARKLFDLRLIRPASLLPVALLMPAVVVISIAISTLIGQPVSQFRPAEEFTAMALVILVLASTFEELGWRGYAMDSLCQGRSYFSATLIFAGLWVVWHLPLFLVNGYYQNELLRTNPLFAVNFLVSLVPLAVIVSWLYRVNRGSIGLIILFHLIVNIGQEALQMGQVAKCIETVVLLGVAAAIVLLNKSLFFDQTEQAASLAN
ncbi:MAG TPA: CPBP family intramembrane glutamic endopeptidase [Anaerolineaceae bacterium]|nr:CPBP family intramembrane glutamic endopeptidase [Anaerolineaceae bacterium]